jgi:hypothetical protein
MTPEDHIFFVRDPLPGGDAITKTALFPQSVRTPPNPVHAAKRTMSAAFALAGSPKIDAAARLRTIPAARIAAPAK